LGVNYRKAAFCCAVFLLATKLNPKYIHKEMIHICDEKRLSRETVHNWVEKFSQGHSKVAGDARPRRPVEIATEATVQQVE
jgi:hypothetical protein